MLAQGEGKFSDVFISSSWLLDGVDLMYFWSRLWYRIFYKDCEFTDENPHSFYGIFSNGERLHGIILGHNPIRVTNKPERNSGIYKCNGCNKEYNQTWVAEELL